MSNYITIESGYYEPFKENETDPEMKVWADKYYEIIKRIHEVLLPYNENFEHFVELENRIDELKRKIQYFSQKNSYILSCRDKKDQIRELLLQSSFIDEMNSLFDDYNVPIN